VRGTRCFAHRAVDKAILSTADLLVNSNIVTSLFENTMYGETPAAARRAQDAPAGLGYIGLHQSQPA